MSTWDVLMGSGEDVSEGRGMRLVFALLLLAGIAFSGYGLYAYFRYSAPAVQVVEKRSADEDKVRLEKMTENIRMATAMRASGTGVVDGAEMIARYPFGAPVVAPRETAASAVVPAQVAAIPDAQLSGRYDAVATAPAPAIVPPYISVKGVMSVGNDIVAMMNIEGEPDGKIYRTGDSFAKNKGKIARITPNKVTVRYGGKNFEFAH